MLFLFLLLSLLPLLLLLGGEGGREGGREGGVYLGREDDDEPPQCVSVCVTTSTLSMRNK